MDTYSITLFYRMVKKALKLGFLGATVKGENMSQYNENRKQKQITIEGLKELIEAGKVRVVCEGVTTNILNLSVDDNGNIVLQADELI